jgi:hypothetical protein
MINATAKDLVFMLQFNDARASSATTRAWDFMIPLAKRFLIPLSSEWLRETSVSFDLSSKKLCLAAKYV